MASVGLDLPTLSNMHARMVLLDGAFSGDHEAFCAHALQIRDKRGLTVPLILQPAQKKLRRAIERARRLHRPVRILYLKARQVMVSTATAAEFFHAVPFTAGQRALIVAHELKASKNLYGYYRQFHDSYANFGKLSLPSAELEYAGTPLDAGVDLPQVDALQNGAGSITYANGSRIEIATADNVKTGRSASIRYLHLSEYAFWRDASTLMTGLMQVVPDDPDTIVVIESTANGVGGDFYRRWMEASAPGYEGDWTCEFFAWHEHPEYVREVANPHAFQKSLTREEQDLRDTYQLTLPQLHWRRWCITNNCDGSLDKFHQEYPACASEAFLVSGRPRFSLTAIARQRVIHDATEGELIEEQVGPRRSLIFSEQPKGAMRLYKRPAPNKQYVIGIDVAEGIDPALKSGGSSDPDYSVANVFDRDTWEQVAKLRLRLEPVPFAQYLEAIARWYNWAFLVPEANGPGIALTGELLRLNYPPALIYHRKPQPDEEFRDDNSTTLQMLGWKTSEVSRVLLISRLDRALRDGSVILHDPTTIWECQTFVCKTNGRAEHQDGCHDDEVFSIALGVVGLEHPPPDKRLLGLARPAPPGQPVSGTVTRYGRRTTLEAARGERVRLVA